MITFQKNQVSYRDDANLDQPMNTLINSISLTAMITILAPTTCLSACLGNNDGTKISFGVVPQFSPTNIFEGWSAILQQVGIKTNTCFELKIPSSIPDFEKNLYTGNYDFAYANPYHAVQAHTLMGYEPIIVDSERLLNGIIVVNTLSNIKNLNDLQNVNLAIPAPNAFGASLLVQYELDVYQINITTESVGTHSNVFRLVASGIASAGGAVNNTYLREDDSIKENLTILYETPGYTSHPIIHSPNIDENLALKIEEAVLDLSHNKDFQAYFNTIQIPSPRPANYELDFSNIEKLDLARFTSEQ